MKIKLPITIAILATVLMTGCSKTNTPSQATTIGDKLASLARVKSVRRITTPAKCKYQTVYSIIFEQYIDHKDKSKGTFDQRIEFGYSNITSVNVLVTSGYDDNGGHYYYETGENELAFLLKGNYFSMEHRYFGKSLPVKIEFNNEESWKYLTTEQAAADAHDVVTEFKKILSGKWVSTGGSKSGMTTEMFAYYHPGDVDLYVPYVAPFCNSISDKRMAKFIYEEAGDEQMGAADAKKVRKEVLSFQVKMLEYRDTFVNKFYTEGIDADCEFATDVTADFLYDVAIHEFAIGFWQYDQKISTLERVLALPEATEEQKATKKKQCYSFFRTVVSPEDVSINNEYTPYYVQSLQELGNYGYDFDYIRTALEDIKDKDTSDYLTITKEEEEGAILKVCLSEAQRKFEQKELMYSKINKMLKESTDQFILIYGSSDPWYSVRPDDVKRDNVMIVVDTKHPHSANISSLESSQRVDVMNRIKSILD